MESDDTALVRKTLQGDVAAFELLFERHSGSLWNHLIILLKDASLAEDVMQESFIKAFDKLGSFNPKKAQFKTWLFTIATRKGLDVLRKKPTVCIDDIVVESNLKSPVEEAKIQEVRDVVNKLEVRERTVVSLYYWQGCSYEQISKVMKAPQGSIKGWMHRAKRILKEKLS